VSYELCTRCGKDPYRPKLEGGCTCPRLTPEELERQLSDDDREVIIDTIKESSLADEIAPKSKLEPNVYRWGWIGIFLLYLVWLQYKAFWKVMPKYDDMDDADTFSDWTYVATSAHHQWGIEVFVVLLIAVLLLALLVKRCVWG
jgi:hypothetical protein